MTNIIKDEQLRKSIEDLKTLRDEIRVDIHLASMDLRDEWRNLERRMPEAKAIAAELKETASKALDALTEEFRSFADRVRDRGDQPRP